MDISKLISKSRVEADLKAKKKADILVALSELVADDLKGSATPDDLLAALMEREEVSSTGIGQGIAIPHGRLPARVFADAKRSCPIAAFCRLPEGVDFESMDKKPVHLVVALFSSIESKKSHLEALSVISRLLRSSSRKERMLSAADKKELFQELVAKE